MIPAFIERIADEIIRRVVAPYIAIPEAHREMFYQFSDQLRADVKGMRQFLNRLHTPANFGEAAAFSFLRASLNNVELALDAQFAQLCDREPALWERIAAPMRQTYEKPISAPATEPVPEQPWPGDVYLSRRTGAQFAFKAIGPNGWIMAPLVHATAGEIVSYQPDVEIAIRDCRDADKLGYRLVQRVERPG